jgi:hypothetical protein
VVLVLMAPHSASSPMSPIGLLCSLQKTTVSQTLNWCQLEDKIYPRPVTELFTLRAPASATAPSLSISLNPTLQYSSDVI